MGRPHVSHWNLRLALAPLLLAGMVSPGRPASAAVVDCSPPASGAPAFGCVWSGPDYTGTMQRFEGDGHNAGSGCLDASPRSAADNGLDAGSSRYRFLLYHAPGCEKGGKAFGVLGPEQSDPDLPDVQSYAWERYTG